MREYGVLFSQFWINPEIQTLSSDAKLLAIYLLSCAHTNMLGCFRLPIGYIAEDLQWDSERVKKGFQELFHIGFVLRDESSGWLVIPNFLKWNPIENPNQGKSIAKLFQHVPTHTAIYPQLIEILVNHGKHLEEGFRNRLQTLLQAFRNQEQDQEQKQEQDQKQDQEDSGEQSSKKTVSVSSHSETKPEIVLTIPLNDQSEFPITSAHIAEWQSLYPAIDVLQTLRNIRGWNLANVKQRKTRHGILKHITAWLAKEQNKGHSQRIKPFTSLHPPDLYTYNQHISEEWLSHKNSTIIDDEGEPQS